MNQMKHIRSSEFLPLGVLLSARQTELEQVVHQLKVLLAERLERRMRKRDIAKKEHTAKCTRKEPVNRVEVIKPVFEPEFSPAVPLIAPTDVVMNVASLRRICLDTYSVGKSPARVGTSSKGMDNVGSRNVMHRLALKLEKATIKPKEETDEDDVEEEKVVPNVLAELRVRLHDIRERESNLFKKYGYTPKQLLNEFSSYGLRIKHGIKYVALPTWSPSSEIVSLIDAVDRRLSTNEALGVLKQLGIEYQPRSAMGKKNLMANGLSSLLASNGLKLMGDAAGVTNTINTNQG